MARPLDRFALFVTMGLCLAWGLNQTAAKVALADFKPMTQAALRSGIGAAAVALYAAASRRNIWPPRGERAAGALVGLVFALEFVALFFAVERTTASRAIVLLFTAPCFVALGAAVLLPSEALSVRQWAGVGLAFVGVAVGFYGPAEGASWRGDALALAAGALWGGTTLVIKATSLRAADPIRTLLYQAVTAALVCGSLAIILGEPFPLRPSNGSLAALGYQSLFVVGVSYPLWFWMLKAYRAAELSALTFLSPVFGALSGWLVLGERPTPGLMAALAGVAGGIALLSWPSRRDASTPGPSLALTRKAG